MASSMNMLPSLCIQSLSSNLGCDTEEVVHGRSMGQLL